MNFFKPKFWDKKQISLYSIFLLPAAIIIQLFNFIKLLIIRSYRSSIPVICVGNIYLGGTGGAVDLILYGLILMIICIFRPDGLISFVPKNILERKKQR